jgi:hypothetical protein
VEKSTEVHRIQIIFYSVTFFFYLQIGRGVGAPSLIVIFAMIQIALLAGQELIWRTMAAQPAGVAGHGATQFVPHFDQRFAGGITGMPGFESIIIPVLNRQSVFALDHYVAAHVGKAGLQEAIREIDELTEQDPTRSASAESIFQPIPCPERRLLSLAKEGRQHMVAWNVARTTLYLSWAFGGPLARAVHCNVGRPELWAMLPSD